MGYYPLGAVEEGGGSIILRPPVGRPQAIIFFIICTLI